MTGNRDHLRIVLGHLANVRDWPEGYEDARRFIDSYGRLRHVRKGVGVEAEIIEYGQRFRRIWEIWRDGGDYNYVNRTLEELLSEVWQAGDPVKAEYPALRCNFLTGRFEPRPRDLLDELACEMTKSRKMLGICQNPACNKFFIKTHSRDKSCGIACGEAIDSARKSRWQKNHKDELSKRRKLRRQHAKRDHRKD